MEEMMMKKDMGVVLSLIFFVFLIAANNGFAEPLTAKMCRDKAMAAAKLLEQKGTDAFAELKDPDGPFRFGDGEGYVWVHDLDVVMLMHPIKPSLDGKNLSSLTDSNGVLFFVAFNEVAETQGAGWVEYLWPKPGQKGSSPKVSFVMLAKHGSDNFVVGSGMYDVTSDQIKKEFPDDFVYEN
jgi:signal transduction histidine kinase